MRMLYVLQQSIVNNEKKWMVGDSNINMMTGFLRSFLNNTELGYETTVDVMIAPLSSFGDIKSYDEILVDHAVRFILMDAPVDAILQRQHFDAERWRTVLKLGNYDVIINCITELSRNIKSILVREGLGAKLITQCFWLDTPAIGEPKTQSDSISYQFRQFDGFDCSDLATFTCKSACEAWVENALHTFNKRLVNLIVDKARIWDFGYSHEEVTLARPKRSYEDNMRPVVISFLNRFTSDDYTNYKVFIDALRLLKDDAMYRDRFVVWCTNPSQRVSEKWLRDTVPNYERFPDANSASGALSREEYLHLLWKSDVSVHLFVKERYGGCALRESIAAQNVIVAADCHEQSRFIADQLFSVPVRSGKIQAFDVAEAMRNAIDYIQLTMDADMRNGLFDKLVETYIKNFTECSFESVTERVARDIELLLGGRDAK